MQHQAARVFLQMDKIEKPGCSSQESTKDSKDFQDFLKTELTVKNNNNLFDDNFNSEEEDNFNFNVFSADLDKEARNFIEQPIPSNIFYPNIRAFQSELFQKHNLPTFKAKLRSSLECTMQEEVRLKVFGILSTSPSSPSVKNEAPRCVSPDLFSSSSSSEDEREQQEQVSTVQNADAVEAVALEATVLSKFRNKADLIADAEKIMIKLLDDLLKNGTANISVVNCAKWENSEVSNGMISQKDPSELKYRNVNLKNARSRHHFAMIMYVLSEVYHLLITGLTCTERELYYKDPELVGNQTIIHSAIKDVCSILNASPWELGIRQSSKGIICGAIKIHMSDNSIIDCYFNDRATLIPNDIQAITFLETSAKFVLIVEKDTIFQKCLLQNILSNLNTDIILITGKGYPDLGTRLMVKRIWDDFHLPIYALVDADPYGIEIMLVYRYGSKAMAFSADQLACPQIRWIGIQPSEIETLAIPTMAQTRKDKIKINELLQRTYISAEIRNELEMLQRLERKAEIEAVAGFSANFLVYDYIPNKIERNLVI
ncbi:meiotic recombination protein W68 [Eupeodes corollae]|uniref:meiotic recombination protein W68 n=1 Tax=Eupeodes corollae TaxID=290404 RepID=UPI002493CBA8|nr:meiotic recombination protein W68 [Eupeodes corollae]